MIFIPTFVVIMLIFLLGVAARRFCLKLSAGTSFPAGWPAEVGISWPVIARASVCMAALARAKFHKEVCMLAFVIGIEMISVALGILSGIWIARITWPVIIVSKK